MCTSEVTGQRADVIIPTTPTSPVHRRGLSNRRELTLKLIALGVRHLRALGQEHKC